MSLFKSAKKVLLVVLDGFGINETSQKNAVKDANTPHLDKLFTSSPFKLLEPGGVHVGLPEGIQGNSEVGHLNLGAGRPVRQDLVRINEAILKNTFKDQPEFKKLVTQCQKGNKRLHLLGLLSDGGVHSHLDHILHVAKILATTDLEVYFHAFMDGRDTPKTNGVKYLTEILKLEKVKLASIQGRSFGMDRDRRWPKIELAYKMMIGKNDCSELEPIKYLKQQYSLDIFDEFIPPQLFLKEGAIKNQDAVFFLNFRPDRTKQLSLALMQPTFKEFKTEIKLSHFLCMTPYFEPEEISLPILFDKEKIKGGLSEFLSKQGIKQYKIAETEKYAHVTYFFNGGEEKAFPGEDRKLIPSPREVKTYDEKPEMSAHEVYQNLSTAIKSPQYQFLFVNFANSDMVGHTGNYPAAIKAVECLDEIVGKLMDDCIQNKTVMLLTADHGNSDEMAYPDGSPHTAHSKAPVPCVLWGENIHKDKITVMKETAALKDVAPTIVHLLGLEKPAEFTGNSIFI